MGYRKLKSGRWRVVARLWNSGKVLHKQSTIDGTRETAKALLEKLKDELRTGRPNSSLTLNAISTFQEILTLYIERRGGLSGPDVSRCETIRRDLGAIPINAFAERFDKYLKMMRVTPTAKTGRPPSNASINRIQEIVKAAFNLAVRLDAIPGNPITNVRFPKLAEKKRDRYLVEDERIRLFNSIREKAPYLEPFIRYSIMVPCRKSELTNLPREAYNAVTNTIYVPDSKAGIPIYKPVPGEMKSYFRNIPADCPFLFYRQESGGYRPLGDFKKAWRTCLKAAGIVNCRVHDLRHCAASDLTIAGNSERAIMDIAGWKTPMLSTYWHKNSLRSAQMIRFPGKCDSAVIVSAAGNG